MNNETKNEIVRAESPAELSGLRVTEIEKKAAGIASVVVSMRQSIGKMGVIRSLRTLTALNQKGGFDCQSCAWGDPEGDRKLAEFCENGAKAVADEATTKHLRAEFFQKYSVAELSAASDFWLNQQGRLTAPMFLPEGATHYEQISWENAFALLAAELNALAAPDEAIFYTSGRTSNEAAFLYQLFVRQFGTNNLPDCSNMCHESTTVALSESIGLGKATIKLEDFEHCDLIIILGQNPGTNHPRMLTSLQHAKENGAKIISINPLPEAGLMNFVNPNPQEYKNPLMFPVKMLLNQGTALSNLHLPVKINGDMAVLQGIMKCVIEAETKRSNILDQDFINEKTAGFAELKNELESVKWADIETESGLRRDQIEPAAELFMQSERVISCWAMGLTQHKNAVATIQELVNLHLLRGQIGKKGAGLCPVRGHSNVQGDRTVGIWEQPKAEFLDALEREFNFQPPRKHGFDTVNGIKAMHAGRAKIFFGMGGNFLSATPDTEFTAEALQKCRLTAHVLTKLNRSALVTGAQALILPCLGRTEIDVQAGGEQFVSTENTMGVVQMSKGILQPASKDLRSEVWITAYLAKAVLGTKTTVEWEKMAADYDEIRNAIERTLKGFEQYNERIRIGGGFYLPNLPREGKFPTADGKAHFTAHKLPLQTLAADEFVMMTIRSHDQFNTTIYGLNDRYRGIHNERRVIFLNAADIAEFGLTAGQTVDLESNYGNHKRTARKFIIVPYEITRRCAATYFPETNVLIALENTAERSNTPVSKYVVITIKPH